MKAETLNDETVRNPDSSFIPSSFIPFAVRTPTATVTDLGTEFGVEVSKDGNTTSHVFRGSVRLQVVPADGETEATLPESCTRTSRPAWTKAATRALAIA